MMKAPIEWVRTSGIVTVLLVTVFCPCFGQEAPTAPAVATVVAESKCIDAIDRKVVVDTELHADFFDTTTKQYPWYIIVHTAVHLEDTTDGRIDSEDLVQIEHTANCVSTHQGKHTMKFCDAKLDEEKNELTLFVHGGLPAYFGDLTITIDAESKISCAFSALYPNANGPFRWRIQDKMVKLKTEKLPAGSRLFAWISVEFEESLIVDGEEKGTRSYKIEGFIKPVVVKK